MSTRFPELPITARILRNALAIGVKPQKYRFLIVQHLREDTLGFLDMLYKCNFRIEKIFGIAYSSKQNVIESLRRRGFEVSVPDIDRLSSAIHESISFLAKKKERFIMHEVGGYLADALNTDILSEIRKYCIGVVEDTKQGLWKYQSNAFINIPVLHVATSRLKYLEHIYVGKGVVKAIEHHISKMDRQLSNLRIGIIGFGNIGSSIAKELSIRRVQVYCYDRDPIRMAQLRNSDIKAIDKQKLISISELIIGASGKLSIEPEEIQKLRDDVLLASASSKRVEFPIDAINKQACKHKKRWSSVTEFKMPWGKNILIISGGFPVNLMDNLYKLPEDVSDLMFAQIATCLVKLMTSHMPKQIKGLSLVEQRKIATLWLDHHGKIKCNSQDLV